MQAKGRDLYEVDIATEVEALYIASDGEEIVQPFPGNGVPTPLGAGSARPPTYPPSTTVPKPPSR